MSESIKLWEMAGDSKLSIAERVNALEELTRRKEPGIVGELRKFLNRPEPIIEFEIKGSDPAGEERVVNLHAIRLLYELGDDSKLHQIAELVAAAGQILSGPDDEIRNAADVILSIGRVEPIEQIVSLCESQEKIVIRNAVRTLSLLKLPEAATGGPVDSVAELSEKVTFEIHRFREELEKIEKLSKGSIILSQSTREFLQNNDYDRGNVKRQGVTLAKLVRVDLDFLDLCYYVEEAKVIVCTFEEAGTRWIRWCVTYKHNLAFNDELGRFVISQ